MQVTIIIGIVFIVLALIAGIFTNISDRPSAENGNYKQHWYDIFGSCTSSICILLVVIFTLVGSILIITGALS